jgi:rhamnosyl/mannosyltransferase
MIVDGQSGLLVPPSDPLALASALERLLLDPEYAARLGDAARERVRTLFSPSAQLDALTGIARRALGLSDAT